MDLKRISLVIMVVFLTATVKGQTKKEVLETAAYTIEYETDWTLDVSGKMNTLFLLFSKAEQDDFFAENINLVMQDLKGLNMTMKSYIDLSENQIKTMVKNSKLIKSEAIGSKYMMVWSGEMGGQELKFKQYFFMKDEKAYVLSLTTLLTTYDEYIGAGDKILNSFKLKE
ncbi:hypothetical protein [Polaribacter pacificus]|nr:hypothetical protein [Polaribacter pacificus]